jgi:integrase
MRGPPDNVRVARTPGSMGALIVAFRGSDEGQRGKPATVRNRNYYLSMIEAEHGEKSVKTLRKNHVAEMKDAMRSTPGKANNWLNTMKALLEFAVDRDWITENPARKVKPLDLGEHEFWPEPVVKAALAAGSPMLRLAIITGICSGARISDAVKMQHGWIVANPGHPGDWLMELRATKNESDVSIPMHPVWLAEIDTVPRRSITVLYNRFDRPFTTKALQELLRKHMKALGLAGYTYHGLRKNAACYLIEQGLTAEAVGSILAMTPETVRYYSRKAKVRLLAIQSTPSVMRGDVLHLRAGRGPGSAD